MKFQFVLLVSMFPALLFAQEEKVVLKTPTGDIEGSLSLPEQKNTVPVALIIAGSGPTDRNGNNEEMENNSLKMLADALNKKGFAALRYDKRGVGQSSEVNKDEMEMRPETYVNDVEEWVDLLGKDKRFTKIIVIGHSEGALLGMLAAVNNKKVKGYVSIAGAGRPIDEILKEQFAGVPENVKEIIYGMLDRLKKGDTLTNVPTIFYALFRPSIQPYMRAWMKYDPQKEIKKLTIPTLIVNGTTDIQVKVLDAELLAKAQPKAELRIIKNMNHVLKDCETMEKELQKPLYNNPTLPLNMEFSKELTDFMIKNFAEPKPAPIPSDKK
jgi:uncharacterized protein